MKNEGAEMTMSETFYERLDRVEQENRLARLFKDRPENLHDYQGCANDAASKLPTPLPTPSSEPLCMKRIPETGEACQLTPGHRNRNSTPPSTEESGEPDLSKEYIEDTARILWRRYVGIPITNAYESEYQFLIDTLSRLERASWTLGVRCHTPASDTYDYLRGKLDESGVSLIQEERQRQMDVEGWTPEHDDLHTGGEMADAAACYAKVAAMISYPGPTPLDVPSAWPWDGWWWKPSSDPIRNLVKAGALIAAEIDRLKRGNS